MSHLSPCGSGLQLSAESVEYMRALRPDASWTHVEEAWPSECFRPLIWMGLIERRGDDSVFRLTELGQWALDNVVEAVE